MAAGEPRRARTTHASILAVAGVAASGAGRAPRERTPDENPLGAAFLADESASLRRNNSKYFLLSISPFEWFQLLFPDGE